MKILLVVGCWLLVVGCWLLVIGCWLLVVCRWKIVQYLYNLQFPKLQNYLYGTISLIDEEIDD